MSKDITKIIYSITIIQLSGDRYFWILREAPNKVIALSQLIDEKHLVENEAQKIADLFGLPVFVEERNGKEKAVDKVKEKPPWWKRLLRRIICRCPMCGGSTVVTEVWAAHSRDCVDCSWTGGILIP